MDDIKSVLLETLSEFHSFCETHNLDYFIIGGTLLGAVRHGGFIPWDDDIDIAMPREHYNQLMALSENFKEPLKLCSYELNPEFNKKFAKLMNMSVIVEEATYKPVVSGIWIDIFPLDYTFENESLRKAHFFSVQKLNTLGELKKDLVNIKNLPFLKRMLGLALKKTTRLISTNQLNYLSNMSQSLPAYFLKSRSYYANLYGAWGIKESAPEHVFSNKKLYNFEGLKVWGPKDSEYWLSKVYGDYMSLPPEHDRRSHHKIKIISNNYS